MSATIRSRSNALLRRVGAVQAGKDAGVLVLEGERLIEDALRAGLALEVVLGAATRLPPARGTSTVIMWTSPRLCLP
jgi:hypothetical protein